MSCCAQYWIRSTLLGVLIMKGFSGILKKFLWSSLDLNNLHTAAPPQLLPTSYSPQMHMLYFNPIQHPLPVLPPMQTYPLSNWKISYGQQTLPAAQLLDSNIKVNLAQHALRARSIM